MTQIDLITKDDLELFKQDLIREISALIKPHNHDPKQWLRSVEVRKLLHTMAIDQPIDFKIPESTVMLVVFLAKSF